MAGQREECQVEEDLLQARISELMEELQGRRVRGRREGEREEGG